MKIIITGVPGTGKTDVARLVAERLEVEYIGKDFFEGFVIGYDEKRDSKVVDQVAASEKLNQMDGFVADTHLPLKISGAKVFTLRCKPSELKKRLKRRGWNEKKVAENIQAEIFNECAGGEEIDTTNRDPIEVAEEIVREIKEVLS
jgi:adenylate kinase